MFVGRSSGMSKWKQLAVGLLGNTISSFDQSVSSWFWKLVSELPRDYFAKTFDQVDCLDWKFWEGMFRMRIEDLKEELKSGKSKEAFEVDLIWLQGLVGKYSLSPVIYEDGLSELEDHVSDLDDSKEYFGLLEKVRSKFREELKVRPLLLKGCIENNTNLGKREVAYYNSLLSAANSKSDVAQLKTLDKAVVSREKDNNSKLRNISKVLFGNPGQALTLFLAAQSALASAANVQLSNFTELARRNDTFSLGYDLLALPEIKGDINENVSIHSISRSSNFRNSNKVRKEVEVVKRDLNGRFTATSRDEFEELRGTNELVEVLMYVKGSISQRYKRSANESLPEMETVPEDQGEIVTGLENKVRELEKEIKEIKNSFLASEKNYKVQISSLEEQKALLERSLGNIRKQFNQTLSEVAKVMVKTLEIQIKDLKKIIEEDEQRYIHVKCVEDIESKRFEDASKKLERINNEDVVGQVVKKVYSNQRKNIPLLLEFGKTVVNVKLKFWIYGALKREIQHPEHMDFTTRIQLAAVLQSECIDQSEVSDDIKRKADNLVKSLEVSINGLVNRPSSDVVKLLIYKKIDNADFDVNAKDRFGYTPLHYAISVGSLDVARLLLNKGADVNVKDEMGLASLHHAAKAGELCMIGLLLDKGADVNVKDRIGKTPLQYVTDGRCNLGLVRLLVDKGADVNVKDRFGYTSLHYAARWCGLDILTFLIDKGADVNVKDRSGKTPLGLVGEEKLDVVKFLKEKGASRKRRDVKDVKNIGSSTIESVLENNASLSSYLSNIALEKVKESNSSFVSR